MVSRCQNPKIGAKNRRSAAPNREVFIYTVEEGWETETDSGGGEGVTAP